MCFSPEADLVAGIVIGGIGIDALRHVRRRDQLALAAIPVVLAAHQLVEAVVWWGLRGHGSAALTDAATWTYLAVAFGVVPVLAPFAVAALEPEQHRRRLAAFVALGVGVALALMYAVVRGPIVAEIDGHHIDYRAHLWQGDLLVALYVVATTGALLRSSYREVRWFGLANLVVALGLMWFHANGLISLWCFWAAVLSVGIAWHLRRGARRATVIVPA